MARNPKPIRKKVKRIWINGLNEMRKAARAGDYDSVDRALIRTYLKIQLICDLRSISRYS